MSSSLIDCLSHGRVATDFVGERSALTVESIRPAMPGHQCPVLTGSKEVQSVPTTVQSAATTDQSPVTTMLQWNGVILERCYIVPVTLVE